MAAARNHQVLKHTIRLMSSPSRKVEGLAGQPGEDLDESDVWCYQPGSKPDNYSRSRPSTWQKKINNMDHQSAAAAGSVPVSIPEWSKKSKGSYNNYDDDDVEEEVRLPPHEVMMRRRGASLSVVEGAGRTLKGRDLSRVRNAIWAQTGFQD